MKKNADGSIETMYGNISPERAVEIGIAAGIMNPDKTFTQFYGGEKTDSHLIPYELEKIGKYNSLVPSHSHQKIDKQVEKLIRRTLVEANALRGITCLEIKYVWAYGNSTSLDKFHLNIGYLPHSLISLDGGYFDIDIYKDEIKISVFHKVDDNDIRMYLTRMTFPTSALLEEIPEIHATPFSLEDDDLAPMLKASDNNEFPEELVEWVSSSACWGDEYDHESVGIDEEEGDHAINSVIETVRNRKIRQTEFSYRNGILSSLTVRFDDEP